MSTLLTHGRLSIEISDIDPDVYGSDVFRISIHVATNNYNAVVQCRGW